MKVMTWKTIDSAPKDGTYVLLHSKSAQYVGAFREGNRFEPQPWELAWRDGSGKFNTVTHWQPLPPPPSALVEGGYDPTTQPYDEPFRHVDTPPSRNDTIRECIAVADNNYYEKLSAANRWFEQGDQGSAIVCRDQARACRDISTALRALLTDEVKP